MTRGLSDSLSDGVEIVHECAHRRGGRPAKLLGDG
jgi:hypothetical protein